MTVKVLGDKIGRNVLTYVDDISVLSAKREDHIKDLVRHLQISEGQV